jgi:hypothetical protein
MDVEQELQLCALALRADRKERCPGEECPLWEDGECTLERLVVEGELYTDDWRDEAAAPA